jgi:hypothetical protein
MISRDVLEQLPGEHVLRPAHRFGTQVVHTAHGRAYLLGLVGIEPLGEKEGDGPTH